VGIMLTYKNEWSEIMQVNELSEHVETSISIIIPARNEVKNIIHLLSDILQQDYPKELFEVIIIDDYSEDETYKVVQQFSKDAHLQIHIYKLSELIHERQQTAYKKRAIEVAVQYAKGNLIITTDADCRVQNTWLRSIASFYEKEKPKLIAAPVCFQNDFTTFEKFQALDFCGMQAITGASLNMEIFNMANGANLAYEKQAFLEVNGYQNIDEKASGDDMLLVYKMAQQYSKNVRFLKCKNAIVFTEPQRTLSDFLQQRFRWTSKSRSYQDKRMTLILGLVYLFVLSVWINAIYFICKSTYSILFPERTLTALINFLPVFFVLLMLIFQLICKFLIDYIFLKRAAHFFNRDDLMQSFFKSEWYHIWYIPFVGTFGNVLEYKWKGRKLS